jgi:hypothetical protein
LRPVSLRRGCASRLLYNFVSTFDGMPNCWVEIADVTSGPRFRNVTRANVSLDLFVIAFFWATGEWRSQSREGPAFRERRPNKHRPQRVYGKCGFERRLRRGGGLTARDRRRRRQLHADENGFGQVCRPRANEGSVGRSPHACACGFPLLTAIVGVIAPPTALLTSKWRVRFGW